ncbi:MAG: hypothetical protein Q9214_003279 [Letrouitia sp. 1 TL-2023]
MWGQYEDKVAGIQAIQYFESKRQPFVSMPSSVLLRSKIDFYQDARRVGAPPVPGISRFPFFVKPAISCASMFISQKSVCHDAEELIDAIWELDRALAPRRQEKVMTLGSTHVRNNERDIVVQEFVEGQDYSCIIIEMCDTPIALAPTKYMFPPNMSKKTHFLTFDIKNRSDVHERVMKRMHDTQIFDVIQKTAVEAFTTNQMHGCSWCNVDIRVDKGRQPYVMEVNPMPAVFLTSDRSWEDVVILDTFPGGHIALLNILISTYYLRQDSSDIRAQKIASIYESWGVERYESGINTGSALPQLVQQICTRYNFAGRVLDLGSGTGQFGRILHAEQVSRSQDLSILTGIDITPSMADESRKHGYSTVHVASLPRILPCLDESSADHVVSMSALSFLSVYDLSLVLFMSFRIAEKSITLHFDEIPPVYNEKVRLAGYSMMMQNNHVGFLEEFGTPRGWKLVDKWKEWSWKSPTVRVDIWCTIVRFERMEETEEKENEEKSRWPEEKKGENINGEN